MFENTYSDSASVQVRRFMTTHTITFRKGLGLETKMCCSLFMDPITL